MYSFILSLSVLVGGGSYYKYVVLPRNERTCNDFWFELVDEMDVACPTVMVDENGRLYYMY